MFSAVNLLLVDLPFLSFLRLFAKLGHFSCQQGMSQTDSQVSSHFGESWDFYPAYNYKGKSILSIRLDRKQAHAMTGRVVTSRLLTLANSGDDTQAIISASASG